jgi:hypothetical protein
MGMHLLKAHELCTALGVRFEDYVDRVLCIPRATANMAIRMYEYDLNPAVGADNMRFLAGIRDEDERRAAETALAGGKSPDTVKMALKAKNSGDDPAQKLEKERVRLERTIESLSKRLEEVKRELKRFDN